MRAKPNPAAPRCGPERLRLNLACGEELERANGTYEALAKIEARQRELREQHKRLSDKLAGHFVVIEHLRISMGEGNLYAGLGLNEKRVKNLERMSRDLSRGSSYREHSRAAEPVPEPSEAWYRSLPRKVRVRARLRRRSEQEAA